MNQTIKYLSELKSNHFNIIRRYCYKPVRRISIDDLKGSNCQKPQANLGQASLVAQLNAKIKAGGPITVANYMKEILTNPSCGYYMVRDVFGKEGDFTTSPEITQIFGELIAIWCLNEWRKIGSQYPVQFVELGPGRGTLSQDLLRVFDLFGVGSKMSIHLVEISPYLAKLQSQKLCHQSYETDPNGKEDVFHYREGDSISGVKVYWYEKLENVPQKFSIFLAHEFFDALPIHKFAKVENDWREILIDNDPSDEKKFRMVCANAETPHLKIFKDRDIANNREHVEYSIESELIIDQLTMRLECYGGIALIVDYGHCGEKTDTFRAFRNHQLHNPLVEPGTADITADVDFLQLRYFAEKDNKVITFGPVTQQSFLHRMGGEFRLKALKEHGGKHADQNLDCAYDMLVNPEKMGSRFKFFVMYPAVLKKILGKCGVSGFMD